MASLHKSIKTALESISLSDSPQSSEDKKLQASLAKAGVIPDHVAIIMDGNGRWAKKKGSLRTFGHKAGVNSVRDITEACAQMGVKHLTLYTFSTENWGRPKTEINALMQLLVKTLRKEAENLNKNDIKLTAIGQTDRFPKKCRQMLEEVVDLTKHNDRLNLCLALSYSGRWDITEAVKKIARQVEEGALTTDNINGAAIDKNLSTAGMPDPDLIIRTSGEYRISNFLLWQLAYSELYITKTYWPDFRREELYKAISSFQKRERRYGAVKDKSQQKKTKSSYLQELIS